MQKQIFYDVRFTASEMCFLCKLIDDHLLDLQTFLCKEHPDYEPDLKLTRELVRKFFITGHFPLDRC